MNIGDENVTMSRRWETMPGLDSFTFIYLLMVNKNGQFTFVVKHGYALYKDLLVYVCVCAPVGILCTLQMRMESKKGFQTPAAAVISSCELPYVLARNRTGIVCS